MSKQRGAGESTRGLLKRFAAYCETQGTASDPFEFLVEFHTATVRQRVDVLLVDQCRRWRSGRGIRVEEYLQKDPEIAADNRLKLELIVAEHDFRSQTDQQPRIEEFSSRFPELSESIARVIEERRPGDRFPTYAALIRRIFDEGLLSATVWGTALGESTIRGEILLPHGRSSTKTFLSQCPPFSSLPPHVIRIIESQMHPQEFDVGESLMRQGDPGTSLMVLCDGEVEISLDDASGNRKVLTRTNRVQVLGEMALLTDEPRSANVVAVTPVGTLVLPADKFHELAGRFPEISVALTLLISERLGLPGRDDILAGKTLDEYRIARRLGRGAMSVVYDAEHLQTGKRVALKMMSHRLVYDQGALAQFRTEAEIIGSFQHENIVRMYGRFAAFRTYFIVMEFADGVPLNEIIDSGGPLPEAEFRKTFGQIVRALTYAHAAGVIHRDIKPANIMLNRSGLVKLMDFGLARTLLQTEPEADDRIVGTLRYMAPEQMMGDRVGPQADLFSLGLVGYEMLAGMPLFAETNVLELLRRHANWRAPNLKQACPAASEEVCQVIEGCLAHDPGKRQLDSDKVSTWADPIDPLIAADVADS